MHHLCCFTPFLVLMPPSVSFDATGYHRPLISACSCTDLISELVQLLYWLKCLLNWFKRLNSHFQMSVKEKKPRVAVGGYLMSQHEQNKNGKLMFWRCSHKRKYECRARGQSLIDSLDVAITIGHNGHRADPNIAAVVSHAVA